MHPQKSFIDTDFPLIFTSYVYHLSREEIFAEKIRALLTRAKGRDLYDLWYLTTQKTSFKKELIKEKLKYYHLENISQNDIFKKNKEFSKKNFVLDLKPLVPTNERDRLENFFDYILDYLGKNLNF